MFAIYCSNKDLYEHHPRLVFLLLLNYVWFYWLSYLRIKIITNENYFGCGGFVIIMIGLRKHQARAAHLFVHFFSGRCFARYNVKLPSYTFTGGNVVLCVPFRFFFIHCGLFGGR